VTVSKLGTPRPDPRSRSRLTGRLVGLTLAGLVVLPPVLSACSNGNSPKSELEQATQQVRNAAAKGTFADVREAVDQLRSVVQSQVSSGGLSAQDEQTILDAAQGVLAAARPVHKVPSSTPLSTPTSVPVTSQPLTSTPSSSSSSNSSSQSTSTSNSQSSSESNSTSTSDSNSTSNSGGLLNGGGGGNGQGRGHNSHG